MRACTLFLSRLLIALMPVMILSIGVTDASPKAKKSPLKVEKKVESSPIVGEADESDAEEGFRQAENFHNNWYNLSTTEVKASHEKLIKFCKIACTKKHCMHDKVADKCHLMCPETTTRNCPDPLKRSDDDGDDMEEPMGNGDMSSDPASKLDDYVSQTSGSIDLSDSIDKSDRKLIDSEGEGG
jgi:hypothetical protein